MYTLFYGFIEKPFEITPDPRFLYLSDCHKEALANLLYAAKEGKGFTVISGEVGTGKTMVGQTLLRRLDGNIKTVYIFNPNLHPLDFLHYICEALGIKIEQRSKGHYFSQLYKYLIESHERGEKTLLIVDEAQSLSPDLLEEIRLLTNLETDRAKLLLVALLGQPELNDLLDRHEFRQLKQRITLRYHMRPLTKGDIKKYIEKRLKVVKAPNLNIFKPKAIKKIYEYSKGTPRLINTLCDNALLTGFSMDKKVINEKIIGEVIRSLNSPNKQKKQKKLWLFLLLGWGLAIGALILGRELGVLDPIREIIDKLFSFFT
jgi:general secretion pathway protein A